jgi:PAS domain S-box-containing protein
MMDASIPPAQVQAEGAPAPGALAGLIAGFDWSTTPLGPMTAWPDSLKIALGIILRADLPMILLWGRHGVCIYNDAYAVFAGARHPALLGSKVLEGWPEVAALNQRVLESCLAGRSVSLREEHMVLHRNGFAEDVWLDLDYSPVAGADGIPAGVLAIVIETTARVLSEWRQRETETQLALALDAADLGIWSRDLRNNALIWSENCKRMFGLAPDHPVVLQDFLRIIHPADRDHAVASLARACDPAHRTLYDVEYRTVADDGTIRWIAARGRAVFGEDGTALRANGTMLDITARKNAELRQACLVELGDRLRRLETTPEIKAACSEILGRTLAVTRAGYSVITPEATSFLEADWTDGSAPSIAGPRLFGALGDTFTSHLRAGRPLAIADVRTAPETAQFAAAWENIGIRAVINVPLLEDGTLVAIVFVHTKTPRRWTGDEIRLVQDAADRTWEACGRAQATQALRELNERLEQEIAFRTAQRDRMWKLSSDVMLVSSLDAVIESVNPAWKTMFGWSEHDLIGRNFIDLTHPEDRPATRAEVANLRRGIPTQKFENRYRRRDGSYLWLSWRAVPDENCIHAVGRDITAEREQAAALQAAEEALRQAQKMEAVGQLTGGIAHDFNNLLQGIVGALEMIDKRINQNRIDEIHKFAAAATASANRAVALTHRLLAFSRRQPLNPKPVAANPLVASMEDLLHRTMGERITIRLALAEDLWPTLCDPNQLESAILNLAINARDAMPDGGTLVLETANVVIDAAYASRTPDLTPGDYICLAVSDTGTGMPPSVIEQAFDPFFTTKPIGQGTGLGLSMIYGFAKQSEGHAKIYSELGHGTTIKILLPRCIAEQGADCDPEPMPAPPRAGAGETVLVVEDEAVVRGLVIDVLDELGFHALEAADGPAGLDIIRGKKRIDLLVTDIGLPGLNGRQLADAARVIRPGLKVLFMTGYAENAAQAQGFLEPGMAMVTKPFPIDLLATRIRGMIEQALPNQ